MNLSRIYYLICIFMVLFMAADILIIIIWIAVGMNKASSQYPTLMPMHFITSILTRTIA